MDYIYEDERIPLQIRRLLIFDEICKLAKKQPDEIIHLSRFTYQDSLNYRSVLCI